jgi:hypothetical protein
LCHSQLLAGTLEAALARRVAASPSHLATWFRTSQRTGVRRREAETARVPVNEEGKTLLMIVFSHPGEQLAGMERSDHAITFCN